MSNTLCSESDFLAVNERRHPNRRKHGWKLTNTGVLGILHPSPSRSLAARRARLSGGHERRIANTGVLPRFHSSWPGSVAPDCRYGMPPSDHGEWSFDVSDAV